MSNLTIADICKLQMDVFYSSPEAIVAGLCAASDADDLEMVYSIVAECNSRGINVTKIVCDYFKRHDAMWAKASGR